MGRKIRAADRAGRPAMCSPGRPPVGRLEHRQRFWAAVARGLSSEDAALQRFAITLDNKIVSRAMIDFRENPEGIDGRTAAQINGIGDVQETQDLAQSLRIGPLPIDLKLISRTPIGR